MFLGEHVLYGSSRLGVATYDKHIMGNTDKSLAYPSVQEIYVCYAKADDTNLPFEPLGDTPTGPIGGNWEVIKPYGTHKVPQFTMPITGVNLPWTPGVITADPMPVTPTKEPTAYVPGFKRYEFSNHLGNVLVTISDVPLGVDEGNNGTVDYYMPDVKTTSDYEPFGAPLLERTFGPEICSTYTEITDTTDVGVITDAFGTSYVPNNTASSSVWYEMSTAAVANVTGGSMYFTAAGTGMRAVGRKFTAVSGKSYSLTLDASRVAGVSDNKLQVLILRVSDMDTMYISSQVTLLNSGAAIPVSMPGIFTAPDNAEYILVLGRPGGNNNALIVDNVSFTYAEPVYTTFTDCHNDPDKGYRFAFNGKEKENDMYGEGNAYDFGARLYDPRIGRWMAIDPLAGKYPDFSPYTFAGNSPIFFWDSDGQKFVNPYKERHDKAALELSNKQIAYEASIQNWKNTNPDTKLTSGVKKDLKEQSGLVAAQAEFDAAKVPYEKVEFFFNTLKTANRQEYDYFNTLTDADGNEIEISVNLLDVNKTGTEVGQTDGLRYATDKLNYNVKPIAQNNKISILLYETNYKIEEQRNSSNPDVAMAANMGTNSGHTYRTFSNELGDIQFWFTKIKTVNDITKYKEGHTSGTTYYKSNDQSYAGPYSRQYENDRVKEAVNLGIDISGK